MQNIFVLIVKSYHMILLVNNHYVCKRDLTLFLSKGFPKTKFMDYSQCEIESKSRDFIYEGCNICGKFDY